MLAVLVAPLCVPTVHQTGAQLQSSQPDSQEASLKPLADGSCPEGTCPLGRCPQGTSPQGTSPQGTNPQGTRPTIVECVPVPGMQDPPCPIPPVCGPDLPACPTAECTCVEVDGERYWACPGEAGEWGGIQDPNGKGGLYTCDYERCSNWCPELPSPIGGHGCQLGDKKSMKILAD